MSDETDLDLYQAPSPVEEPPAGRPLSPWPALVAIVVIAAAVVAWYLLRPRHESSVTSEPPQAAAPAPTRPAPAEAAPVVTMLPPLDESDPAVRDLVGSLSNHALVGTWLSGQQLLRGAAGAVVAVAEGRMPVPQLRRLAPTAPFTVRQSGGRTVVDPASYARYTPVADAIESLDSRAVARVYTSVKSRLGEAYAELGTGGTLDEAVRRAYAQILAVPVIPGDVAVVPSGLVYAYADPGLEDRPPVQKLLLRMGPENVRRIQAKTRELAGAMGIDR